MTVNSTRRAVLAGAAALPALSLPAIADSQISFPELAEEFEDTYREWLKQSTADQESTRQYRAAFEGVSGVPWKKYDAIDFGKISEEERDRWHAIHRRAYDSIAAREYDWTELNNDLYSLCDEILEQPAVSIADLKIQVRAFALSESHVWLEAGTEEIKTNSVKRIVEAFCRHIGLEEILPGAAHLAEEA
jgi:hypothetical protein